MTKAILALAAALLAGAAFAQKAPAPAVPDAAATVKAVCKDGTPFEGTTLRGACRGHGGVDKAASAGTPAVAATPAKPAAPATTAPAPGGGAGQVWANEATKVYHCQGDRYYGTTKNGKYMTEAEAKAAGMHASRNKACS